MKITYLKTGINGHVIIKGDDFEMSLLAKSEETRYHCLRRHSEEMASDIERRVLRMNRINQAMAELD